MYSLKFVTENNKEYSFENMSLETSALYVQDEAIVKVTLEDAYSKISIQVENDRVKNIYHTYSTSLRNFNKAIVPDSGRNFIGMSQQTVYFWTKCYETRVNDIKTPLYILCGQDNCSSLCFGVIGQDYERDFVSLEPHGGRALSEGSCCGVGVALDTWYLHKTTYRVTGHAQMVLQAHLCGILNLRWRATKELVSSSCGHGTGYAHLTLAAYLSTRYRGVVLHDVTNKSCCG